MSESKASYTPIDPDHLTAEQVEQLRFVLSMLSPSELVQVTAEFKRICKESGFGEIVIKVENGHMHTIQSAQRTIMRRTLDANKLHSLME